MTEAAPAPVAGAPGPDAPQEPAVADEPVEIRALLVDAVVVVGIFLVVGAVVGALWPHLVTPVTVTRTDAGLSTSEVGLSDRFGNDGWFSALGGLAGLVTGLVLMAWRRTHEVVSLLLVTGGAFLAAWVAATVGQALGPADPQDVLAAAASGSSAPDVVRVSAEAAYFVWPIAAVLGALLVLWSPPGQRVRRTRAPRDTPSQD